MKTILIILALLPGLALALDPVADNYDPGSLEDCDGKKSTNCNPNRKIYNVTCTGPTQRVDDSSISQSDISHYVFRARSTGVLISKRTDGNTCSLSVTLTPGTWQYKIKAKAVAGASQDSAYTTESQIVVSP